MKSITNLSSQRRTDHSPSTTAEGETALSVRNLTKTYSNGAVTAVDGISFDIEAGSVVGLLGPNGAGKTTTIKSMLGTVVPDAGTVEIAGRPAHENKRWVHGNVGVMFEGSRDAYWRLTVRENLEFFTRLHGVRASERRERHDELLDRLGLAEKADVPVRMLSRGMKQKVAVASTLAQDVELAFLDEPTLGLDVATSLVLQEELRSLASDRDMTVLLTSHDMGVIETLCDRVIVLSEGRIIADDSVDELLELFQKDAYRFRLAEPVPEETSEALHSRLAVREHAQYAGVHEFEVTLQRRDVHDLSDLLRELDCTVQSFETASPDLAQIFLELTAEGEGAADA